MPDQGPAWRYRWWFKFSALFGQSLIRSTVPTGTCRCQKELRHRKGLWKKNMVYHTKSFALCYRFCPVPDYGCEPKSASRMVDIITPEFIPGKREAAQVRKYRRYGWSQCWQAPWPKMNRAYGTHFVGVRLVPWNEFQGYKICRACRHLSLPTDISS